MLKRNLIALLPLLALCQEPPDREPSAEEWGYRPEDGATVAVNPPALSWVASGPHVQYDVQLARDSGFTDARTISGIPWSVYTHDRTLAAGEWHWRYRAAGSRWSRARRFTIPPGAPAFPQPGMEELARRIPRGHPRLFLRPEDVPRLQAYSRAAGAEAFERLRRQAEELMKAGPTPEPSERGSISNPATRQFWWSNRLQTLRACQEAETLAMVYLASGERRYGEAARKWILHLAAWDPDGPTNWKLNDEAAMPILHRLARAYDWAWHALGEEDRRKVRAAMLRRARDAWQASQTGEGWGHLNKPYNSHGNRSWHKLAETAIALYGDEPQAVQYLHFTVSKFFAAYPVWSDDDGGWHEGLSYWAGYMVKAAWWMEIARVTLQIDPFRKPFFANFAAYALYTAPPGSPDMGFGDLSSGPPSSGWAFVHYFAAGARNPYWSWWAEKWNIQRESGEPALGFLWGGQSAVAPKPPTGLPPSKIFHGTGVAVLNSNLLDSAQNVQVRFKSSPMGRRSHGHDPHNSFTLNAYGSPLLVNNVYRDVYGSAFHRGWCWETVSQNALLVNGQGQKPHSADLGGRIVKWSLQEGLDYVAGEAAASYEGKLRRFVRHVIFVKPGVVVIADDVEPAGEARLQWMLHARAPFKLAEAGQALSLDYGDAGVRVDYAAPRPLALRQWTGYEPPPDKAYLDSIKRPDIPPQWHAEAAMKEPAAAVFAVAVLRPYRKGQAPEGTIQARETASGVALEIPADGGRVSVTLNRRGGEFATVRKDGREWTLAGPGR